MVFTIRVDLIGARVYWWWHNLVGRPDMFIVHRKTRPWKVFTDTAVLVFLAMVSGGFPAHALNIVSARRSWVDHSKVTVTFSEAVSPASATAPGYYSVERAAVLSAQLGATSSNVVLTVSSIDLGPPPTLVVNGVQNLALSQTLLNASVTVSLAALLPAEMGTTVSGFQDDFNEPTRDTNWLAIGPDVYEQAGGFLNLGAGSGDPNHLIYVNPAYNGSTQEVLARIKMANASLQADALAGVAVGVPTNSWSLPVRGGLNLNLLNPGAYGGPGQRHFRFLSDYTEFGPLIGMSFDAPRLDVQWPIGRFYPSAFLQEIGAQPLPFGQRKPNVFFNQSFVCSLYSRACGSFSHPPVP